MRPQRLLYAVLLLVLPACASTVNGSGFAATDDTTNDDEASAAESPRKESPPVPSSGEDTSVPIPGATIEAQARIALTATQYSTGSSAIVDAYELRAQGFAAAASCTRTVVDACEIDACMADQLEARPFEAGVISFAGGSMGVRELKPASGGKYEAPAPFGGRPFTMGNEISATWPGTLSGVAAGSVKAKAPPFILMSFDERLFSTTENLIRMPGGPFSITWVPRMNAGLEIEASFVSSRPTGARLYATCRFDAAVGAGTIRRSIIDQLQTGTMQLRAVQRSTVKVDNWTIGIELRTIKRVDGTGAYRFRSYDS